MSLAELRQLVDRQARSDGPARLDGVQVSRVTSTGPQETSMSGAIFALVVQGEKTLMLGDREFRYGAGQYLIASLDLPVSGRFTRATRAEPALGFGMAIRASTVAELLLHPSVPSRTHSRGASAPSGIAVGDATDELVDAAIRMLRLLDHPRDLPVLAPLIEREILWRLITGPHGEAVRQLGLSDSSLSSVGRSVRWIRENYDQTVRVEDLARIASMSPSAFHRSFTAVTALSPIQFQKRIRLQEARLRLLAEPGDVAGVGHAVGYESASQFSREYRRLYGLPPGRDAVRMRSEPSAAG